MWKQSSLCPAVVVFKYVRAVIGNLDLKVRNDVTSTFSATTILKAQLDE